LYSNLLFDITLVKNNSLDFSFISSDTVSIFDLPKSSSNDFHGLSIDSTVFHSLSLPAGKQNITIIRKPSHLNCIENKSKNQNENIFTVYPNPNNGSFFLKNNSKSITPFQITIYNILGKIVLKNRIENYQEIYHFSLDNLPNGLYFIKTLTKNGVSANKMVILK